MTVAVVWFGGGTADDGGTGGVSRRRFRVLSASADDTRVSSQAEGRGRWAHLDEQARTESWLQGIRDGDERALERMVRACYAPVASFALRYAGTRELAEEVTQDVFVRIWERREEIDIANSWMSYLFSAARHRALNAVAPLRERASHVAADEALVTQSGSAAPDLLYDAAELSQALRVAVDRLAPRGREVFLLSRRDGLTPAQIASALGIGVQTVYTLLARALQELHRATDSLS
jgi:RNA polymerase sigma-70 factor (ECF subfamily)